MEGCKKVCLYRCSQVKHCDYVITVFQQPDNLMINYMHEVSLEHQELRSILCIVEACRRYYHLKAYS